MSEQNKMNDDLQFQDFSHDEKVSAQAQTHTFVNFPHSANSDDEDGDSTELLKNEKKPPNFWTFEYYKQFFDVETHQVLRRIVGSMTPIPGRNFLTHNIRPNPDLYGPFWICTTLVFTTAIAGNLSNYLQSAHKDYQWKYDFQKVTFAATAIFCYWWLLPLMLFGVLWWRGSPANYSFLEIISVYGYSLAIYIPISILWVIQVSWLQWLLVIMGTVLSGSVLLFTFWPAIREDTLRIAGPVMAAIFIFHAALAAGFVLYFFYVPATTTLSPLHNVTITNLQSEAIVSSDKIDALTKHPNIGLKETGMHNMSGIRHSIIKTTKETKPSAAKQPDKNLEKNTKRQTEKNKIALPALPLTGDIKQRKTTKRRKRDAGSF